jgi:Fe-S-cluster containining protein
MPQKGAAQAFASQAVRETLGASSDADSCMALAARINALMDQAFESFRNEGVHCREGCNFCCHLRVMVYPHEAIALFRYLVSRMPEEQANEVRTRLIENAARIGQANAWRMPCAFLVNGKCSAYEVRPAACSGYHSLSRGRCETAHQQAPGTSTGIPVLQSLRYVAAALDDGMDEGLAAAGLSSTNIELHTAVAALVRNPGLIDGWRAGQALTAPESVRQPAESSREG